MMIVLWVMMTSEILMTTLTTTNAKVKQIIKYSLYL